MLLASSSHVASRRSQGGISYCFLGWFEHSARFVAGDDLGGDDKPFRVVVRVEVRNAKGMGAFEAWFTLPRDIVFVHLSCWSWCRWCCCFLI